MKKTHSHKPRREHAQGIVEFALVLPILLLVMFGIIEVGRLLAIYASVATASREAARYASAVGRSPRNVPYYQDCFGMRSAAQRMGILVGIAANSITIDYDHGPNTGNPFGNCPSGSSTSTVDAQLGDRVIIGVTAQYKPLLGLVRLPAFPIESHTARTIVKDVKIQGTPAPLVNTLVPTHTPTAAANQPVVTIIPPSDCLNAAVLPFGTVVHFAGTAIDVPDGDISSGLRWTSSIDGFITTGASFSTAALSFGMHTIIAEATDSNGNVGLATCSLTILAPYTPTPTNTPTPTSTETPTITPTVTNSPTITLTNTPGPSPTPTDSLTPTPTSTDTPLPTSTNTPTPTPTNTPLPCQLSPGLYNGVGTTKITWDIVNSGPYSYTLNRLTIDWPGFNRFKEVWFGTAQLWTSPNPGQDANSPSIFGPSAAEWIWPATGPNFNIPAGPGTTKAFGLFWENPVSAFSNLTIAVFINDVTGTTCSVSIIFN
jgi:Flp pilus assembly protein TadG